MMAADVGLREFAFDGVVAQPAPGLTASNKQQEHCYSLIAKVCVASCGRRMGEYLLLSALEEVHAEIQ